MADLTRSIPITVPDNSDYIARVTAWINALPPLMEDSGEVDDNGDPIMQEVSETLAEKFDRIAGEVLRKEMKERLLNYERRAAQASVSEVPIQ